jgi:glutamate synthase domain-containing protein 2
MTDTRVDTHAKPPHKEPYLQGLLFRYSVFGLAVLLLFIGAIFLKWWLIVLGVLGIGLGIYDVVQNRHAVLRNYPLSGHVRYVLETFRPEVRQYLFEDDQVKVPFSRQQRALAYQRAKNVSDTSAFGTLEDLYQSGKEWFLQSTVAHPLKQTNFRIRVGNEKCQQPYDISVFNISAMSFGSLSAAAIESLNKGANMGGFAHDTGEGAISPYHRIHGGDLIWELGTGYFGCRNHDGTFNPEKFAERASDPQVKMVEIKLSQGAKPGKGGVLPKEKITPEIAATRDVPMDQDCISPASHSAFSTPREMVKFWQQLRVLSGGKPVGFKLCVGQPWQFMAIVKAMIEENDYPDFIVVDGAEGGTGAAPVEFMDNVGMPLLDGFLLVHNTLVGAGIRDKIKIGVSGKIISAFDLARMLALGADWCNSARGFMFAVGCIQSRSCHTNRCPTGVATQDPYRQRAIDIPDKSERVYNFHKNTIKSLASIVGAVGINHPQDLKPYHIARRLENGQIKLLSRYYYFMDDKALLTLTARSDIYNQMWVMSNPDSFLADNEALVAYNQDANERRHLQDHAHHVAEYHNPTSPDRIAVVNESEHYYYTYEDDPNG